MVYFTVLFPPQLVIIIIIVIIITIIIIIIIIMSSLGVFSDECSTFLDMMNDIGIDKKQQHYIIKKMVNIAIRSTYFIFCCRNRNWDNPD